MINVGFQMWFIRFVANSKKGIDTSDMNQDHIA